LDPPPDPRPPAVGEADVAVAEEGPHAANSPMTAHITTAAMIHPLLDCPEGALEMGRAAKVASEVVGSYSFMMAFLLLGL
jgi:hypothetical protein